MPFIEHHQRLYPLQEGKNVVGGTSRSDVRLPGLDPSHRLTIVVRGRKAAVQAAAGSGATVNGRPLGVDARGLHHEDRLGLNGTTLVFLGEATNGSSGPSDDRAGAARRSADGGKARPATPEPAAEARPVPALIRVDDGQAYPISGSGLKIGREKTCDIVIADRSVSRLHAEVSANGRTVLLRDLSRNGTRVNGEAARETQPLRVGDAIEIGAVEFRFVRRAAAAASPGGDVTPVRAAVPDAPTAVVRRPAANGSRDLGAVVLRWSLILAVAGLIAAALLLS